MYVFLLFFSFVFVYFDFIFQMSKMSNCCSQSQLMEIISARDLLDLLWIKSVYIRLALVLSN